MVKRTRVYNVNDLFEKRCYEENGYTLQYRLYIPKAYDCGEKYPLVVFLHGAGERGSDNEAQLKQAVQVMFNDPTSPIYDSIVIAPQCPQISQWVLTPWVEGNYPACDVPESRELECVCAVMDEITGEYNVDRDRVYVTGLSMGGFGTWDLLSRHGARFAAGMPICGGGDPAYAKLLTRIPIRTFHGSEDDAVPVNGTRRMYAAIRRAGGENIDYTEFDGAGHHIWDMVYGDRDNIDWLFSHTLADRRKKAKKKAVIGKIAAVGGAGAVLSLVFVILKNKKKKK